MVLVLLYLPGTWICYGVVRFLLGYLNMPMEDKVALAFLTALVYLLSALMRTWEIWQQMPKQPEQQADTK